MTDDVHGESTEYYPNHCEGSVSFEKRQAHDAVVSDPCLSPSEKETLLRFSNNGDQATVYTENKTLTQDLILYPHFDVTELWVSDTDRFRVRMNPSEWQADGRTITGVKGYLPIGCLKIQAGRRSKDWVSLVVSDAVSSEGGGES